MLAQSMTACVCSLPLPAAKSWFAGADCGGAAGRRAENERLDEEFPARLYDLQLQKFRQTSDVHAAEEKIQASTRRRVLRGAELAYGQAIAFAQARKTIRQVKDKPEGLNTAAAKFQRRRCFRRQTFLLAAGISMTTMPPADDQTSTAPSHHQERQRAALLILDMVNRFDFVGAEKLQRGALEAARCIDRLRREFRQRGLPVIYVNDNFGEWHSESSKLVEQALERDNPVTELIRPMDDDFFVIKPQFSGFYATNLPVLLPKLGVTRLVLTGVATDICVLFTAADAHMRDYALWIPEDAVAAESKERGSWALEIMASSMGARTAATSHLSIADWTAPPGN